MSIEAIQQVTQTEKSAQEKILAANAQARQIIRDAEQAGQLLLEQARKEAETQARNSMTQAEAQAAQRTQEVLAENKNVCLALSQKAQTRLDDAAVLIVKRIVSV